jgi:hypothetical protein
MIVSFVNDVRLAAPVCAIQPGLIYSPSANACRQRSFRNFPRAIAGF